MKLQIIEHNDDTTSINGTKYSNKLFEAFGVTFSSIVGQVLRIDNIDGVVTITRLNHLEDTEDEWEPVK